MTWDLDDLGSLDDLGNLDDSGNLDDLGNLQKRGGKRPFFFLHSRHVETPIVLSSLSRSCASRQNCTRVVSHVISIM